MGLRSSPLGIAVALAAFGCAAFGCNDEARKPRGYSTDASAPRPPAGGATLPQVEPVASPTREVTAPGSFVELAKTLDRSVVTIRTFAQVPGRGGLFPWGSPDDQVTALGSGFVLDADGHVLTNDHVIGNARDVQVVLFDGREFGAKVVGRDEKTDLGLLKIDAPAHLEPARLGDSDALEVGEWVVAIGNPYGLDHTVTAGIVSAKGRGAQDVPFGNAKNYTWNFIQTDASINPGNSGGPLINTAGEVIGINTAIIGGGTGIGFAIPINMAKQVLPALKRDGRVARAAIGVFIAPVSHSIASQAGLDRPRGALIADVVPGRAAAKADIHRGDIILTVQGKDVDDRTLPWAISTAGVGQSIALKVWRAKSEREIKVVTEAAPN